MPYSENISKKEAARIVGVSEGTIVRWVKAGKFPQPLISKAEPFSTNPRLTNGWLQSVSREGFRKLLQLCS